MSNPRCPAPRCAGAATSSIRRLAFASASTLLLSVLAGCVDGDQSRSDSADQVRPVATGQDSPAPAEVVEGEESSSSVTVPAPEGQVDMAKLMSDQVLPDVVIGDPAAPVTIVEYASMTCDHCAAFHANTFPTLKRDYLDTGKAKLIIREFPFDPRATAAFMLARCTPNDGRTAMIDVLFSQAEDWAHSEQASEKLLAVSRIAGFSQETFKACLSDKDLQSKIVDTKERGEKEFGVNSTPTFFINGRKYVGALPPQEMAAVIDDLLEQASK